VINGKTRLIGVLGWPVSHTRSPHMHNAALKALGLNMVYVPLAVEPGDLGRAVQGLRALGFAGANVTIPHKEAVMRHLDVVSPASRRIGAVNTIVNRGGRLYGTTTDPEGVWMTLKKAGIRPAGRRVTVLGTGGTARTVLFTLAARGFRDIALAGRRPHRARGMVAAVKKHFGLSVPIYHLSGPAFDKRAAATTLLVNCTSVGMAPATGKTPVGRKHLHNRMVVFDIVYNPLKTRLLIEAARAGARTLSGINMLVYQGMAAFKLWTGKTPLYGLFLKHALRHE
jgi:shikimate dehydrogenase